MMKGVLVTCALLAISVAHQVSATKHVDNCVPTLQKACGKAFAGLVNQYPALVQLLSTPNAPYTVFCPSDWALKKAKIPQGLSIEDLLKYHIVPGVSLRSKDLVKASPLTTAFQGKQLKAVKKWYNRIQIVADLSKAYVIKGDSKFLKGRIHKIDTVLIPKISVQTCKTVWAQIVASPDLSTLKAAVEAAGLVSALNDPYLVSTVFAPTNKAFAELLVALKTDLASLVANKNLLLAVLKNHVVPGAAVRSNQISDGQRFTTLDSKILIANVNKYGVFVKSEFATSSAKVVYADITACKSVVHAIDAVLVPVAPPSPPPPVATCKTVWAQLVASPDLSILKAAVEAAGLVSALDDPSLVATVFAPKNKAFVELLVALKTDLASLVANKNLLLAVLKNHVVPGAAVRSNQISDGQRFTTLDSKILIANVNHKGVFIKSEFATSSAKVVYADITACKSVVHAIDAVLVPVAPPSPPSLSPPPPKPCTTIWAAVCATPDLSILKAAIEAAGLVSTLNDPYLVSTVFAPTNKAFADLLVTLKTDLASLVANKNLLLAVLKNHVVPGAAVKSTELKDGQRLTTLDSKILIANVNSYGVFIKSEFATTSAKVVIADVATCKSIVHVINAVLVPVAPPSPPSPSPPPPKPCTTIWAAVAGNPEFSALKAAIEVAGLVSALDDSSLVATVFAPNNAAFAALLVDLKTDLASLLTKKDLLVEVLKNHVVPGAAVLAKDITDNQSFKTLGDKYLIANVMYGGVTIKSKGSDKAYKVITADVITCKSVVHSINGVLVPAY